MKSWRLRRQLSQAAAARAASVHRQTWRAWERNTWMPEEFNYVGIERALRWEAGSVAAILAGGEPTPVKKVKPLLLDEFEEDLWAITELSEGMRWDRIMARRKRRGKPPTAGDDDVDGRPSGTKGS